MVRALAPILLLPLAACGGRFDVGAALATHPITGAVPAVAAGGDAGSSGNANAPATPPATPGQLSLRVTATGFDDANGHRIGMAAVDKDGRVAATSANSAPVMLAHGGAEIVLDRALLAGQAYDLVYYVDTNGDGVCDAAPTDSGGTLPFTAGSGDTQLALSSAVGSRDFACGTLGQHALSFEADNFQPHLGQTIFVVVSDLTAGTQVSEVVHAISAAKAPIFTWPALLNDGHNYQVGFFADFDGNKACSPNVDHQYMKAIAAVSGDVTTAGSHGLNIFPVCSFFPEGALE